MTSAVMANYARIDIAFPRGEGPYLFAEDGRRYLDFACGIAVTSLGHGHPKLTAALKDQIDKVWHVSNLYNIEPQTRLANRLAEHSFAESVFFCNSGAEALEACLKLARSYHDKAGDPDRYRVITFEHAFHGRTLATIAAGGQAKHLNGFGPNVEGFDKVPFGDLEATRAAITPETAAILVEPVQGEGGIHVASPEFLQGLRALADESGALLIFDEVQCGMGRTGKLFAYEWAGVEPDVMSLAKALGNGFPIGACLANARTAEALGPGSHGSTFGGNPLATTAANAVLDVMLEDGFFDHVQRMGDLLTSRVEGLIGNKRVFESVRGKGLMIGLQCVAPSLELMTATRNHGLLTVIAEGNTLRLLPPLTIDEGHIDEACQAIESACNDLGS